MRIVPKPALFILTITALMLISLASFPGDKPGGQNSQRAKLEKSKKELENEIQYTNNLLNETRKNRKLSVNQVIILNNQIKKREQLIQAINNQVDELYTQIDFNQMSVEQLRSELKKLKTEYARMINQAYKNQNGYNRLMFIFAARDFNQAYQRLKYFQQFSAYRKAQINKILNTEDRINHKIRELVDQKNNKIQLVQVKETEKSRLSREKAEKSQTVTQLQQKEKELRAKLKEKEAARRKLQSAIENLIAEEVRKSAETAKKTGTKPASNNAITMTPAEKELSNSFSANRGRLPWPAEKGIVSSTFGEHDHPVLKGIKTKNNGINIVTNAGASARAVFSGTVSAVMSIPNLNYVVIIRHGDYLTVYSNLETVSVKKGDKVKTKQSLGKIYADPDESKTELHFEVWEGKNLLDPQNWLAH